VCLPQAVDVECPQCSAQRPVSRSVVSVAAVLTSREESACSSPGIARSYDADGGVGYIVREPDRHQILVRSSALALGVDALYEGDRVAFDIDMAANAQARNVMRTCARTRVSPGQLGGQKEALADRALAAPLARLGQARILSSAPRYA
jgi:cold shock CspA family protein